MPEPSRKQREVLSESTVSEFSDDFRVVAQQGGALAAQLARARLGEALFGQAAEPLRLGRLLLLERLGQGGMGVVYSAYDPELDRRVAVKLLRERLGRDMTRARKRLMREARALAKLSHPNVVPIHDVGFFDGHLFLVMEHIAGPTLATWSQEPDGARRSWRETLEIYLAAGRGLAAAHDLGHRASRFQAP